MAKGTVEIGIDYYEKLVRDSEKLRVIESMLKCSSYLSDKDIRIILEIQDKKAGEE